MLAKEINPANNKTGHCKLAHEVVCEKNNQLCNQTPIHPKSLDNCCPKSACNLETLKFKGTRK